MNIGYGRVKYQRSKLMDDHSRKGLSVNEDHLKKLLIGGRSQGFKAR